MASGKINTSSYGFTLIELMVVIAIMGILVAIAVPNFLYMRDKGYCTEAETDAENIASEISNYFSLADRIKVPEPGDLDVNILNPFEITGDAKNIIIRVTDRTSRCPTSYQGNNAQWDSNSVFTLTIR